jgi:uncharacterized protein (TIGR02391 family)
MASRSKPPRSWTIDDLLDLGDKEGVTYLKAVPILILETWIQRGREKEVANYVRTKDIARRLVSSGLVEPFKPKGTSNIVGALGSKQVSRNLTRPTLMEFQGDGSSRVNLPHYEPLLQEYRHEYSKKYEVDYRKLFPNGEPEWEQPGTQKAPTRAESARPGMLTHDAIHTLLVPIDQALRYGQQAIERLERHNQQLRAENELLQVKLKQELSGSHHRIVDDELRADCAKYLMHKDSYIDALRRAGVVLEERLRKTLGRDGHGKNGVELVDASLSPKSGKVIITDHPAEQEGVYLLFRGAIQFVRNPPAHKKVQYTELEAWQSISLIDYLLLLLQQARLRGS